MTIPQRIPDPLELSWVIEVRRGPQVAHMHPDQVDRYLDAVQDESRGGHIRIYQPSGSVVLDESDLIEIRNERNR